MGDADPKLAMVVRAFSRHIRKDPPTDDDILAALDWIEAMSQAVRHGQPDSEPVSLVKVSV